MEDRRLNTVLRTELGVECHLVARPSNTGVVAFKPSDAEDDRVMTELRGIKCGFFQMVANL